METELPTHISKFLPMQFIWQSITFAIYFVGLATIIAFLYDNFKSIISIIRAILEPYFQPELPQTLSDKFGKWAVVTGATDGIGREYARELAKHGLNLVLISRTEAKLIAITNELEEEFKVKTKWIAVDFSKGREVYEQIEKGLAGITVGILVNNVGRMYDYPEELDKVPVDVLWEIINVNIGAVTLLTHSLIPQMKSTGRGAIVNISSGSELQPIPYMAVYAASKTYVRCFTQALEWELASYKHIVVQCVTPLFVITKMNQYSAQVMQGNLLIPDARSYARSAVYTLGKSIATTGYWTHGLQYFFMKMAPEAVRTFVSCQLARRMRHQYLQTAAKNVRDKTA